MSILACVYPFKGLHMKSSNNASFNDRLANNHAASLNDGNNSIKYDTGKVISFMKNKKEEAMKVVRTVAKK